MCGATKYWDDNWHRWGVAVLNGKEERFCHGVTVAPKKQRKERSDAGKHRYHGE